MKTSKAKIVLLSLSSLTALLTGCASIMCGSHQEVPIASGPAGVQVLVYDSRGNIVLDRNTPCTARLPRRTENYEKASYVVLVRKPGYAPVQVPLNGSVNRAYYANILFGGIGLVIDPITGGMWTLSPEN